MPVAYTNRFGVSFSLHRCSELELPKKQLLQSALEDLGARRFRLMSYWNIHEPSQGNYNFDELDWQIDMIAKYKGKISLCLGKRQPRWPECHIPEWALALPKNEWYESLYNFISIVVKRYMHHPAIESWQLENEALLADFGYCKDQDYNRARLRKELDIVKKIDPERPVIMTLSDSYGIPLRKPTPNIYGMSLYRTTINKKGKYAYSKRPAMFYKTRAHMIGLLKSTPVFIHELQAEPWLPEGIKSTPLSVQTKYMNARILKQNVDYALKTGALPIDLWGLEWWYYLKTQHNKPAVWNQARRIIKNSAFKTIASQD